ncbi:hypothetical protein WJX73_000968 [Symbiochloris irregularis]|uniref:Protein kinase domain-containing protein n=1 Tax=Symbiochloris irregularis TaxID=706552 RepID=A0AAW1NTK7_9CHLO
MSKLSCLLRSRSGVGGTPTGNGGEARSWVHTSHTRLEPWGDALGIFGSVSSPYNLHTNSALVSGNSIYWAQADWNFSSALGSYSNNIFNPDGLPGFTRYGLQNSYTGGSVFSGAACAAFTVNSSIDDNGIFLVDDAVWQQAALDGLLQDVSFPLQAGVGVVDDACDYMGTCTQNVQLNPETTYQVVLLNSNTNSTGIVRTNLTFESFNAGAAECADATPSAPPNGTTTEFLYPRGYVEGQVMRETMTATTTPQPSAGALNFTAYSHLTLQNASCVFYSMAPRNVRPQDQAKFSLGIYLGTAMGTAIYDLDTSQPYNLTSCNMASCNATAGTWAYEFGLTPSHSYFMVATYAWPFTSSNTNTKIDLLVQAFGADRCAQLEQQVASTPPPAPPPSPVSSAGAATQSSTGSSSSSAGAIAGGVVGGVVGVAAIAALALVLMRRRQRLQRQQSDPDAKVLPLNGGKGGALSSRGTTSSSELTSSSSQLSSKISSSEKQGLQALWQTASMEGQGSADVAWAIDPSTIRICTNPDGTLVKLGQGGFGMVFKAVQDDVRMVAVKISHSNTQTGLTLSREDKTMRDFWDEIKRLADCRDTHILQFFGAAVVQQDVWLVTEYCERGDLFRALNAQEDHVTTPLAWHNRGQHIALDVARGIHALHIRNMVHCDIKSPNILLTKNWDAKVADVGLARPLFSAVCGDVEAGHGNGSCRGTWDWQAPESLLGQVTSTSADIYSFGVVLHELMSGEEPARGRMREVRVPEEAPEEAVQLMEDCLLEDPAARPRAKQIVERLQHMVHRSSHEAHPAAESRLS